MKAALLLAANGVAAFALLSAAWFALNAPELARRDPTPIALRQPPSERPPLPPAASAQVDPRPRLTGELPLFAPLLAADRAALRNQGATRGASPGARTVLAPPPSLDPPATHAVPDYSRLPHHAAPQPPAAGAQRPADTGGDERLRTGEGEGGGASETETPPTPPASETPPEDGTEIAALDALEGSAESAETGEAVEGEASALSRAPAPRRRPDPDAPRETAAASTTPPETSEPETSEPETSEPETSEPEAAPLAESSETQREATPPAETPPAETPPTETPPQIAAVDPPPQPPRRPPRRETPPTASGQSGATGSQTPPSAETARRDPPRSEPPPRGDQAPQSIAEIATQQPPESFGPVEGMYLVGVFRSRGDNRVLIQDSTGQRRTVRQGEQIDGWVVASIGEDTVQLRRGGQTRLLSMAGSGGP